MLKRQAVVIGAEWHADILPSCASALHLLGLDVHSISTNSLVSNSSVSFSWCSLSLYAFLKRIFSPDNLDTLAKKLSLNHSILSDSASDQFHPDFLIYILAWGEKSIPENLSVFKNTVKIGWLMDDPFGHDGSLATTLPHFDHLYVVDSSWIDNIRYATGKQSSLLPCGVDPNLYYHVPDKQIPSEYQSNIVFIGSSYFGHSPGLLRRALLEPLLNQGLHIYGDNGWKTLTDSPNSIASSYRGRQLATSDANLAYNGAKIVINIHHPQFRDGTSLRTFAIAATGAFQLIDDRPGINHFYKPGSELITYSSPNDLSDKAKYYLNNVDKRIQIAQAGLTRTLRDHTYVHRMKRMLIDLGYSFP